MIYNDFNLKANNEWVLNIVESSDALNKIMEDIQNEIPQMVKAAGGSKQLRKSMALYICNPTPFTRSKSSSRSYSFYESTTVVG